jgi:Animal haem peroxidase
MPRIAHGASVTPEQLQQAQEALASRIADIGFGFAAAAAAPEEQFGFMFPDLQRPADRLPTSPATVRRLKELGRTMVEDADLPAGDAKELPATYTYFGQFIDHDITLEKTSFTTQELIKDDLRPLSLEQIKTLTNQRSATLDLDSVYGPDAVRSGHRMVLGKNARSGGRPPGMGTDNDLKRKGKSSDVTEDRAAQIGDPRNDENLIISQLHVAFLKAHNRLVDQGKTFGQARQILRQHYQHMVLVDFLLRRVGDKVVIDDVLRNGNRFYRPEPDSFFVPLEFTVAAFRFGHTMVRAEYDYNLNFSPASLDQLFTFTALSGGLGGFDTLPENWIIQWRRFIAQDGGNNPARKLDTTITRELFSLRKVTGEVEGRPALGEKNDAANLAVRNLLRGYALRMPTGQAVARKMEESQVSVEVLTPNQLLDVAKNSGNSQQAKALKDGNFHNRTPLWYYLLAEAKHHGKGNRLGPVGSRIVAEVLAHLVRRSEDSILQVPNWIPTLPQAHTNLFSVADLLRFAKVVP